MAFIIKDNHPQNEGEFYFVGRRKIKDPMGNDCEAADFGTYAEAHQFSSRGDAEQIAGALNQMARQKQFTVEEISVYNQRYGKGRTNGFSGFGTIPGEKTPTRHGGFVFDESVSGGYNGF